MKKGPWKKKNEENFTILEKLAEKRHLYTPEIEEEGQIPHASLRQRIDVMLSNNEIVEIESKVISKKGLPVRRFQITTIGLIKWFSTLPEEYIATHIDSIIDIINYHLPPNLIQWTELQQFFDDIQLIKVLVNVCRNTKIELDKDLEHIRQTKLVSSRISLAKTSWAYHCDVIITMSEMSLDSTLRETLFDCGGKKDNQNNAYHKIIRELDRILVFAFYHCLLLKLKSDIDLETKINSNIVFGKILSIIRNSLLFEIYMKYFQIMLNQYKYTGIMLDTIYSSLASSKI